MSLPFETHLETRAAYRSKCFSTASCLGALKTFRAATGQLPSLAALDAAVRWQKARAVGDAGLPASAVKAGVQLRENVCRPSPRAGNLLVVAGVVDLKTTDRIKNNHVTQVLAAQTKTVDGPTAD